MASRIDGDFVVQGNLLTATIDLPVNCVGDGNFNAAQPLTCTKQNHQYARLYSQPRASTVVSDRQVIHIANGAGSIAYFRAMLTNVLNVTGATVAVHLYKNGSDITSIAANLIDSDSLFQLKDGTLTSVAYNAGDVFEVSVTATAGGGTVGKGLAVHVVFREAAE